MISKCAICPPKPRGGRLCVCARGGGGFFCSCLLSLSRPRARARPPPPAFPRPHRIYDRAPLETARPLVLVAIRRSPPRHLSQVPSPRTDPCPCAHILPALFLNQNPTHTRERKETDPSERKKPDRTASSLLGAPAPPFCCSFGRFGGGPEGALLVIYTQNPVQMDRSID